MHTHQEQQPSHEHFVCNRRFAEQQRIFYPARLISADLRLARCSLIVSQLLLLLSGKSNKLIKPRISFTSTPPLGGLVHPDAMSSRAPSSRPTCTLVTTLPSRQERTVRTLNVRRKDKIPMQSFLASFQMERGKILSGVDRSLVVKIDAVRGAVWATTSDDPGKITPRLA